MAAAKPAAGRDKSNVPIVIKRIKKGGHGHHGGVWKIAYADFVTAMMAFFLLMWVLGSTTTGDLAGISAYFQNPLRVSLSGGQGSGDATRPIAGGGENLFRTTGQEARADSYTSQRRISASEDTDPDARLQTQRLESAKSAVEQEMRADPMLNELNNQVFMVVGVEGLRIQIVDDKNRPMFAVGSAEPLPYTRRLLRTIGRVLSELTNQVRLEGHTDNRQFGNGPTGYSNWELSTERANAARRELIVGGMNEKRTAQVSGYADSLRLNPDDAADPINRRISITVLRTRPPAGLKKDGDAQTEKTKEDAGQPEANIDPAANALKEQLQGAQGVMIQSPAGVPASPKTNPASALPAAPGPLPAPPALPQPSIAPTLPRVPAVPPQQPAPVPAPGPAVARPAPASSPFYSLPPRPGAEAASRARP